MRPAYLSTLFTWLKKCCFICVTYGPHTLLRNGSFLHLSQCSTVVCNCCKGDVASQWQITTFGHLGLWNPWTDRVEIWHDWLSPPQDTPSQFRWRSVATVLTPSNMLQQTPLNRFWRAMAQTTCLCTNCCFLGLDDKWPLLGFVPPKTQTIKPWIGNPQPKL